ncbi:MAG: hypothetical protein ACK4HD_12050 [Pannonibacter phragmitetus]
MPDITLAKGLIASAKALCPASSRRKPRQADLRRAVSAAYYAVFHELARTCADALVGATKARRPNRAWVEVYRGLDHGTAKNACNGASNVTFPQEIRNFSDAFKQLQAARHSADYDPMIRLDKIEALGFITLAEDSIAALKGVRAIDKIAFATWVLIASKGASEARSRVREGRIRQV